MHTCMHVHTLKLLSVLGRHAECLELWSTINPSPTDLPTQLQLALALHRAGKYAESIQGELSSSMGSGFTKFHFSMADCLQHTFMHTHASAWLQTQ